MIKKFNGVPGGVEKNPLANTRYAGDVVRTLVREDALEEGMATHSSILASKNPWTGEPSRLPSTGWQRVEYN